MHLGCTITNDGMVRNWSNPTPRNKYYIWILVNEKTKLSDIFLGCCDLIYEVRINSVDIIYFWKMMTGYES